MIADQTNNFSETQQKSKEKLSESEENVEKKLLETKKEQKNLPNTDYLCKPPIKAPTIGQLAPDFQIQTFFKKQQRTESFKLSDFRGVQPCILLFYPLTIEKYANEVSELLSYLKYFCPNYKVMLIYGSDQHLQRFRNLYKQVSIITDFERRVIRLYGCLCRHGQNAGLSYKAFFVVDKQGILRASSVFGFVKMMEVEQIGNLLITIEQKYTEKEKKDE